MLKLGKMGLKKCINQKLSHSGSLSHRHFWASSQFQHVHVYSFRRTCISLHQEAFFYFIFLFLSWQIYRQFLSLYRICVFLSPSFQNYLSSPLCSPCRSSLLLLAPLLADTDPLVSRPPGSTEGLQAHFHWIADHVPAFRVPGGRIHILQSPDEFYQAMKVCESGFGFVWVCIMVCVCAFSVHEYISCKLNIYLLCHALIFSNHN